MTARFETLAIHAGQSPDIKYGAIMTPVYQTSTYVQPAPGQFVGRCDYARTSNPTRTALEDNIAALESGKHGITFSSGCAAITTVLHSFRAGDHIILCDDVYGGTFRLFANVFNDFGLTFSLVDLSDLNAIRAAITPSTRLVWIESPTNPMLKVIDINAVVSTVKELGIRVLVDNTFASPYLQNPLQLGADIVLHSMTKYIGGHSDLIGGVLVLNDDPWAERLLYLQNAIGAVPAPWECFLLLRSTKTLHVRMERHCHNAEVISKFLESHSKFEKVYYPGLPSHPTHAIAKKQMRGFGGIISVVFKDGLPAAERFLKNLKIFALAESLGGVESLVEHPAIMTHHMVPREHRQKLGLVDGLIRFSIGIEAVEDLVDDISQALLA